MKKVWKIISLNNRGRAGKKCANPVFDCLRKNVLIRRKLVVLYFD